MISLEQLANPDFRPMKGPPCGVSTVLTDAPKEIGELLLRAMDNPYAPSSNIARAITDKGYPLSQHAVQRHRRRECRCP